MTLLSQFIVIAIILVLSGTTHWYAWFSPSLKVKMLNHALFYLALVIEAITLLIFKEDPALVERLSLLLIFHMTFLFFSGFSLLKFKRA
jgi:hypothetical protein